MQKAFITGVAGTALSDDEKRLLRDSRPVGLILFARNLDTVAQIKALIAHFKATVGTERVLVLIDQEGGRVQRLRPPLASLLPPAATFVAHHHGDLAAAAASAKLVARLLADELRSFGIDTDCAPVVDIPISGAHDVIGNRAFARDAAAVIAIGRAFAEGLMAGGILPVIKHIPGHGRAFTDSHLELPVVDATLGQLEASDLVPFKSLADLPAAMTAHVVFSAIDADAPATTSPRVVREIVRDACGFDGLLISDDLGMKALSGSFRERTLSTLAAGVDIALHCSGEIDEMRAVAEAAPWLEGRARARLETAYAVTQRPPTPYDASAARSELERLNARSV